VAGGSSRRSAAEPRKCGRPDPHFQPGTGRPTPYGPIRNYTGGLDGALVDRFAGYRGHLETVSELNEIRSG
jgi:hypothetical protein